MVNLSVDLISTVELRGVLLSLLDSAYYLLFGRYIYLYREYLDKHKINSDNSGNFDQIKEVVTEKIEDVKEEVNKIIKTDEVEKPLKVDEVKEEKKEVKKSVKKTRKKKGEE